MLLARKRSDEDLPHFPHIKRKVYGKGCLRGFMYVDPIQRNYTSQQVYESFEMRDFF